MGAPPIKQALRQFVQDRHLTPLPKAAILAHPIPSDAQRHRSGTGVTELPQIVNVAMGRHSKHVYSLLGFMPLLDILRKSRSNPSRLNFEN
ncbi:hypothetical protein [Pinirhizobacter soli]|uniref:hypothetical protein n=1 Tax=Pinirhizobacter soli TaxID=2786953 RepID=UPI00202A13A5|nr:hypothetical protein [Pinirhizobacter soli]